MMLYQFYEEYNSLTPERQVSGLKALFDELLRDPEQYEDFIHDILCDASSLEADDYFGTEGLNV